MRGLPDRLLRRLCDGGAFRIAALGDSLTAGWMVQRGYFHRACELLEERAPALELGRIDAGVPGDTAFGGLGRLPAVLDQRPDLLLIQFGLNDCFVGERVEVYRRNLERIVAAGRERGVTPVLVTSCPLEDPGPMRLAQPYYQAQRDLGRVADVLVADTTSAWLAQAERGGRSEGLWQADGVHPTDAGHAVMAGALVRALTDAC